MEHVVFIGSSKEQVNWGGNDDPSKVLVEGQAYELEDQEIHSWHTKFKLKGIDGWFNSASFQPPNDTGKET